MPRLKQKPLLSLGTRQIRLRNTSINNAPKKNTGFYQTQLGKQYRGSGIFMRGGSVRTPTAMLRRRRGKGLHLKGGKRSGKLGDSLKRGKGIWDDAVARYKKNVGAIRSARTGNIREGNAGASTSFKENLRVLKKKYGRASAYQSHRNIVNAMANAQQRKRGGRLFGAGGHGIWKGGAGLVRGSGRRVQRRARVI